VRGKLLGRLPLVDVRVDLLVDEALERALDLLVLVRVLHLVSSCGERAQGRATPNCIG
jgi:hypothetical protein